VEPQQQSFTARWLRPSENVWRLSILDCTEFADGMASFSAARQIADSYSRLRSESGQELSKQDLIPRQSFRCNLAYEINKQPSDGPVFKSRVMEEKWDIYLYDSNLYFCRSWTGELVHCAVVETEPKRLRIVSVQSFQNLPDKLAVRQVDFLCKSHLLLAVALHPLLLELGHDAEKQARYTFGCYGCKGRYGTLEETLGTPCWNQTPVTGG
jgi:hypothetical protein